MPVALTDKFSENHAIVEVKTVSKEKMVIAVAAATLMFLFCTLLNLFIVSQKLTREDIFRILKNTENGFDDIISTRSKPFLDNNLDTDNMKTSELVNFIIDNPTVLKRPIIVSNEIMEVGYNADDIRAFIPPEMRNIDKPFDCDSCEVETEDCAYHNDPAILAKEIKEAFNSK